MVRPLTAGQGHRPTPLFGQNAIIPITNALSVGIYTVLGRAITSCTNVTTATVTSIPLPTVSATGTTVCWKDPAILTSTVIPAEALICGAALAVIRPIHPQRTYQMQIVWRQRFIPFLARRPIAAPLRQPPLYYASAANRKCHRTLICKNEPFNLLATGAILYNWAGPNNYTAS